MQCVEFERILEQQDEGVLPKSALAHADGCEGCRGLMADIAEIRDLATVLRTEEVAPPERVWIALRNQLEAEGLVRNPLVESPSMEPGWWNAFQRPAFAGAFLALVLVAAMAISYRQNPSEMASRPQMGLQQQTTSVVPSAESVFNEEVLTVGNDSIPGLHVQDAAVTASFRRNLGIVDNFIKMCEKSVREQPDNEIAREYLYGAYQQKAELLATAMNRSMTGGLQ